MNCLLNIIILGGGTAGWMAANLLVKKWSKAPIKVTLVESPDIGIIGVGEGSTPSLKNFFQVIDVAEHEWMPRCNATYKTNIRFSGWSPASGVREYSHPFVSQLDIFTKSAFFANCLTRRFNVEANTAPQDFFLNSVLAQLGKSPVTPPNFPFHMQYGYHFDSYLLGQYLADLAVKRGVIHKQEKIIQVRIDKEGSIAALITEKKEELAADYFIDCSGFASILMQKTLGVRFKPFKENLFNDSAVVMPTDIAAVIPVETRAQALSAGWCWKIPLRNRFGNGYVYSSDFIAHDRAEAEFRQYIGTENSPQECRHLKMHVGQLEHHWVNNCLGLGLSQGFIEPLEATALHLVQTCIELFILKFEAGNFTSKYRAEFNSEMDQRFERVRDYIVAHYKLNTRDDSEYWRANRNNMNLSESLLQILDVWYRKKDLTAEIGRQNIASHFGSESWHCLLAGYGAFPPITAVNTAIPDAYQNQKIYSFFEGCALNFNSHRETLERQLRGNLSKKNGH
ncbi:tryptophan halogenase family protein [Cellvibrio sp. UBA7671]|uniref:tryptophan halogenase family protein n=1 Tax=Cellvibrio sp. UBA7671 TaxID=1946312 RepID=UPI002F35EA4D